MIRFSTLSTIFILMGCSGHEIDSDHPTLHQVTQCSSPIFLTFCQGISMAEFNSAKDNLSKTRKITPTDSTIEYSFFLSSQIKFDDKRARNAEVIFDMQPMMKNDSLKEITLEFVVVRNHIPADNLGSYSNQILKTFKEKYGIPAKNGAESDRRIEYQWFASGKNIRIQEDYTYEYDRLSEKGFYKLNAYRIIYSDSIYFSSQQQLDNIELEKYNKRESDKASRTKQEI